MLPLVELLPSEPLVCDSRAVLIVDGSGLVRLGETAGVVWPLVVPDCTDGVRLSRNGPTVSRIASNCCSKAGKWNSVERLQSSAKSRNGHTHESRLANSFISQPVIQSWAFYCPHTKQYNSHQINATVERISKYFLRITDKNGCWPSAAVQARRSALMIHPRRYTCTQTCFAKQ